MKKKILVSLLSMVIVAGISVSSYAAYVTVQKEKNVFQKAKDEGIELSQVDTNNDFRYSEFNAKEYKSSDDDGEIFELSGNSKISENVIPGDTEKIDDPKIAIYNKMLNSIDYFNALSLTMETSMLNDEITTIEYNTNINSGESYQKVSIGERIINETYGESDNMTYVNNSSRTYAVEQGQMYDRDDAPYIPLEERIISEDDGMPCYYYRKNITNCPYASYSIFPQELTFSYLKDFEMWEIVNDNVDYLDRNCVMIEGKPSPYIAEKHVIDSFTMIVDSQTGILMQFTGTLNGDISRYMTVTDLSLETRAAVKHFNENEYSSFTEVSGRMGSVN